MRLDMGSSLWARLMYRPLPSPSRGGFLFSGPSVASVPKPDARDSVLLSEEGRRLSRTANSGLSPADSSSGERAEPSIGTARSQAAAKLPEARNAEIGHYLRRAASVMTAMKDLARLGQESYLTSRDRLELDRELTALQAELAGDTARTKLILDGRSPGNPSEASFFDVAAAHVRRNQEVAVSLLEREFYRRERGLAPGEFLDNGDGTSTVTILDADFMKGSYVTRMTGETEAMSRLLDDWKGNETKNNNEEHTVVIKRLSHEEFLEKYAVLSLRSVGEAERSEKLLAEKLKKLPGMAAALDDAYDKRGDIAERRAEYLRRAAEAERLGTEPPDPSENPDADDLLNPDGVTKAKYNPLFRHIEDLWRIDELWRTPGNTTFKYIVE